MINQKNTMGISFDYDTKCLDFHKRKYLHDFKVPINNTNFEGSQGLDVPELDIFLVSKKDIV